jgi:type II secretory pathway pseudopilin PulG
MAMAGLIMGYISLAATTIILLLAVIAIPSFMSAKRRAETAQATNTIRNINAEAIDYYTRYATSGYAPDLATLGQGPGGACTGGPTPQHACLIAGELGSARCTGDTWCTSGKFRFLLAGAGSPATDYVIVATPLNENTGNTSYCSTSDAVVRSRYGVLTSPPSVAECETWTPI